MLLAQVVSLFMITKVSVLDNETDKVWTGALYKLKNKQGLTIPHSLLKNNRMNTQEKI